MKSVINTIQRSKRDDLPLVREMYFDPEYWSYVFIIVQGKDNNDLLAFHNEVQRKSQEIQKYLRDIADKKSAVVIEKQQDSIHDIVRQFFNGVYIGLTFPYQIAKTFVNLPLTEGTLKYNLEMLEKLERRIQEIMQKRHFE